MAAERGIVHNGARSTARDVSGLSNLRCLRFKCKPKTGFFQLALRNASSPHRSCPPTELLMYVPRKASTDVRRTETDLLAGRCPKRAFRGLRALAECSLHAATPWSPTSPPLIRISHRRQQRGALLALQPPGLAGSTAEARQATGWMPPWDR